MKKQRLEAIPTVESVGSIHVKREQAGIPKSATVGTKHTITCDVTLTGMRGDGQNESECDFRVDAVKFHKADKKPVGDSKMRKAGYV